MKTLEKMRRLFQRHSTLSSSQGGEDSSSTAQVSSRIPQQQSTSRKSFGPSSTEGRGRSRTPNCGAPRGGSPYPQPPPPAPPLPKGTNPPVTQPGDKEPTGQNKDSVQPSTSDQGRDQPQCQGQGHLQGQEVRLVYRENGPDVPRGPVVVPAHEVFGLWCDLCNRRVVELKRQALRLWMPFASSRGTTTIKVSTFNSFTVESVFYDHYV